MAEKDIAEKLLEAYNDVFADIVNLLLFDEEQTVKPDDLVDAGTLSAYKFENRLHEPDMKTGNLSFDKISKFTGLSLSEIETL